MGMSSELSGKMAEEPMSSTNFQKLAPQAERNFTFSDRHFWTYRHFRNVIFGLIVIFGTSFLDLKAHVNAENDRKLTIMKPPFVSGRLM